MDGVGGCALCGYDALIGNGDIIGINIYGFDIGLGGGNHPINSIDDVCIIYIGNNSMGIGLGGCVACRGDGYRPTIEEGFLCAC